jgi:hypothetical protein
MLERLKLPDLLDFIEQLFGAHRGGEIPELLMAEEETAVADGQQDTLEVKLNFHLPANVFSRGLVLDLNDIGGFRVQMRARLEEVIEGYAALINDRAEVELQKFQGVERVKMEALLKSEVMSYLDREIQLIRKDIAKCEVHLQNFQKIADATHDQAAKLLDTGVRVSARLDGPEANFLSSLKTINPAESPQINFKAKVPPVDLTVNVPPILKLPDPIKDFNQWKAMVESYTESKLREVGDKLKKAGRNESDVVWSDFSKLQKDVLRDCKIYVDKVVDEIKRVQGMADFARTYEIVDKTDGVANLARIEFEISLVKQIDDFNKNHKLHLQLAS